jgi:hypothetical protein
MVRAAVRLRVLPETRDECRGGVRPCPLVSCRYHLLLNVTSDGRMYSQRDFDEYDPVSIADAVRELEETCALDVAERGGEMSLEDVGGLLGVPRERVFVDEQRAHDRLAVLLADAHPDDPYFRLMAEQELKRNGNGSGRG